MSELRRKFGGKVAVTGGAATGKSTVVAMFRDQGWTTASADEVAGRLFRDDEFQRGLAEHLGMVFPVDRALLRERAFEDVDFRRALNAYFHGPVMDELSGLDVMMIEVPLLFESVVFGWFSSTVLVSCDHGDQVRRLIERSGSREVADRVISSQLSQIAKLVLADEEIRTSCPLDDVLTQTKKLTPVLKSRVSSGQS